ncbi:hypothetical protein AWO35_004057 [Escherichia coli]|nr:hypothetical protein [Escherichia coli]HAX0301793.1 hypothetical protein [Escherichia coli CD471]EFJ8858610.1 hypothetical protein [Escherichia coli]EFJ9349539.1 hypothetical protein [Escherichia coli]EFJ9401014.1 hypothetical protein [Escherichia coli]
MLKKKHRPVADRHKTLFTFHLEVRPVFRAVSFSGRKILHHPSYRFFSGNAEGYDLPASYGVGVNHMAIRQDIQVDTGMKTGESADEQAGDIQAGRTRQKSHIEKRRLLQAVNRWQKMAPKIMMKGNPSSVVILTCAILLNSAGAYGHEAEGMFAKLLSLQVLEDISVSGLGSGSNRIRKFSAPWHSDCQPGTGKICAGVMARGSYMDVKIDMEDGDLFHWEAYGLSVGGDGTVKLSDNVSLRGGVSVGYSRIYNRSHIQDDMYRYPALEWKHKNVLFVSPEIEGVMTAGDFSLQTGVSFQSASELSSRARDIGTLAGSYFVRAAYTFRDVFTLTGRQGNIIVGNNTGGFYGAGYRDDLGFSLVNETQLLADIPFAWDSATKYIRIGPGLLLTDNGVGGVSFTFSLRM